MPEPTVLAPPGPLAVYRAALTAEFATLTRKGTPITVPTTPYVGEGTLDVSTGLTYPAKAERARRDPRVCLLFADPVGSAVAEPEVVAVQGLASVRDADLQANADRYVRVSTEKLPEATRGQPRAVLRRMTWYFARIWIEVTPVRILRWPDRSLSVAADEWLAPSGAEAPPSDPPPAGTQPPPWLPAPSPEAWREAARHALASLPMCDVTVVDRTGFPLVVPAASAHHHPDGFALALGPGAPALMPEAGSADDGAGGGTLGACVTFHGHPERFTGQENRTFLGRYSPNDGTFAVQRLLADWSLAGGRIRSGLDFLGKGRRLKPRLHAEAARRGQPVPMVRFPDEI